MTRTAAFSAPRDFLLCLLTGAGETDGKCPAQPEASGQGADQSQFRRSGRTAAFVLATVLAGCGGGGGQSALPATKSSPTPAAAVAPIANKSPALVVPSTVPAGSATDDWTTFAHDFMRSGYQPQNTGINEQNVSKLAPRWLYQAGAEIDATPLVSKGVVYIAVEDGTVRALSAQSGALLWTQSLGAPIRMTPTLDNGLLFVGTYKPPATFAALNASNGAVVWKAQMQGCIRGEPVVTGGRVFEGESCGDPPECNTGGVHAYDEQSGNLIWTWNTSPVPNDGGAVWGPMSFDGTNLYFGTGNICYMNTVNAQTVVSLTTSGKQRWVMNGGAVGVDDDFGGGTMLNNGQIFVTGKDANLYDIDASAGTTYWFKPISSVNGFGSIGTPTTNGTIVISSTGNHTVPQPLVYPGGGLIGFDQTGTIKWQINTQLPIPGYAAMTNNGIAFANLDTAVTAIDAPSGNVLWTYNGPASFYASPVVVPSGVYTADAAGNVYAFGLPASVTESAARRSRK